MEKQKADKFASYTNRFTNNFSFKVLSLAMLFNSVVFVFLAFANDMMELFYISPLFLLIFYINYRIFKSRAKYYLSDFSADSEKIVFLYYEKDTPSTVSIFWKDLDFCFGKIKQEEYLVIWDKNREVFKFFKTFADHKQKFENLRLDFYKYIPAMKIKESTSIFSAVRLHTKSYSLGFGE